MEPSQAARGSVPSGEPKRSALPVIASPMTSHQKPAIASPARRQAVGASAAMPMKAGPSATDRHSGGRQHERRALAVGLGRDEPNAQRERGHQPAEPRQQGGRECRRSGGGSARERGVRPERAEHSEHEAAGQQAGAGALQKPDRTGRPRTGVGPPEHPGA